MFSLGSLLYALSSGRPPFRAETPLAVLRKISETRPRPIQQIHERIPAWFDRLVAQLMQIDIARRIDSAQAAANLLRDAHAHVRNPSTHGLPKSLKPRRYRVGLLAIATLLSLTVTVVGVLYFQANASASPEANAGTDEERPEPIGNQPTQSVADVFANDDWQNNAAKMELLAIQMKLSELASQMESDSKTMQDGKPNPL